MLQDGDGIGFFSVRLVTVCKCMMTAVHKCITTTAKTARGSFERAWQKGHVQMFIETLTLTPSLSPSRCQAGVRKRLKSAQMRSGKGGAAKNYVGGSGACTTLKPSQT